MAVTSATLAWRGATGEAARGGGRSFTAVYFVTTDDGDDQANTVIQYFEDTSSLPGLGSSYSYGNDTYAAALCDKIRPVRDQGSAYHWFVTVSFSVQNEDGNGGIDENGDPTDDPISFRPSYSYGTMLVRRPVRLAQYLGQLSMNGADPANPGVFLQEPLGEVMNINATGAIMNSAGEVFDPPIEYDYGIDIVTITINRAAFDGDLIGSYKQTINSNPWQINDPIRNFFYAVRSKHQAKLHDITVQSRRQNEVDFFEYQIAFHVDPGEFAINAQLDAFWNVDIADIGHARFIKAGAANGDGGTFADADIDTLVANGEVLLDQIRDRRGYEFKRPVSLINGQPKIRDPASADNKEFRFLRWQVFDQRDHAAMPLLAGIVTGL